jgi:PleD family two-component response regulator
MDLVAKLSDDAFGVLLPGTTLETATGVSDRLRAEVEQASLAHAGVRLQVTLSIGLTQALAGDDTKAVMTRAETALQVATDTGGNRVRMHDGDTCRQPPTAVAMAPVGRGR